MQRLGRDGRGDIALKRNDDLLTWLVASLTGSYGVWDGLAGTCRNYWGLGQPCRSLRGLPGLLSKFEYKI